MLKWRLFFAFAAIILFVVGVVFGTVYFVVYNQVVENAQTSYDMIFSQYASNLSGILEACKSDLLTLSIDDNVQELLLSFSDGQREDTGSEEIETIIQLDSLSMFNESGYLFSTGMSSGRTRYNVVLYAQAPKGDFYQLTSSFAQPLSSPAPAPNLASLRAAQQKTSGFYAQLYPDGAKPHISIYKTVYDLETFERVVGILSCEIPLEDIRAHFFSPLNGKYNISTCFIDPTGNERSFYGLPHKDIIENCTLQGTQTYSSGNQFVMEYSVDRGAFYLVGVISMAPVTNKIFTSLTLVIISMVIALILAFVFSLIYASHLTKPIRVLSDTMKTVEYSEVELTVPPRQIGEIRELYESFNNMIETINKLIYENYITALNKKQSELNALQSQINTHFLYNTLDTVNWLAMDYGAEDISLIVKSLSSLLRLSLNKGREMISMQGELEHVKAYIEIQKIRYDNSFTVEFKVDERALNAVVPKMLLQPLVENSIYHGFETDRSSNEIIIEVYLMDDCVHEIVKNAGTDINLQTMSKLTSPTIGVDAGSHYGVKNISQRLSLNYGDKALYYYSIDGGYTAAHIIMPYTNV